ncbi:DUF1232 domain-containing protein [Tumebacillus sp. ITR2]|uniref:DUF1232 domain-containing protein n=1 Tax=Tumebacillus amylolyticus TaxID=2801339 RepID=A0ABS1JDC3_9BACL|nr:YkvA family protein [Tumebacillus amylolyticus]MBL0388248.1 DUF1232 domain-containing protein [Tumebacillus amylolyticus]
MEDYSKYQSEFSDDSFWEKVKKVAKKVGAKGIYAALLLYFAMLSPNTPMKAKAVIAGALGYFIFPIDLIPDIIPAVGYTDDFGALMSALALVAMYIDADCKSKAREKLRNWFGNDIDAELDDVDNKVA